MAKNEASEDRNGLDGFAEGPEGDTPMSFFDHVAELRRRLIYSAAALVLGIGISFNFVKYFIDLLKRPLIDAWAAADLPGRPQLQVLEIEGALMVDLRVAIVAGIFLALPVLFYQLWQFISPGLYKHEKRFVIPFVAASVVMFCLGALFAYKVVLPFATAWLLSYPRGGWLYSTMLDHGLLDDAAVVYELVLSNYIRGTTRMLLAFGLVFEFPLLVAFLAKAGVVTHHMLAAYWRIAVIVIFVVAGVLTPPEPVSQVLMALPLVLLYFISILVAYVLNPAGRIPPAPAPDIPAED